MKFHICSSSVWNIWAPYWCTLIPSIHSSLTFPPTFFLRSKTKHLNPFCLARYTNIAPYKPLPTIIISYLYRENKLLCLQHILTSLLVNIKNLLISLSLVYCIVKDLLKIHKTFVYVSFYYAIFREFIKDTLKSCWYKNKYLYL